MNNDGLKERKPFLDNRVIRVFISSTFRDMQDERDELMKKTFPVLRRKAAERDVTLTELDLRWGITPEESKSGKVVEICLREIENSVPFFVGIIGNRYGWIPTRGDLGDSIRERFSQVNGYVERHLSVTEMEMQFGVLERAEDMHAFFFIKEQETDDVDDPGKLAALKSAVRSNGRYPVSTYTNPEDLAGQVEEAFTKLLDELYPEGSLSELEKERIGQRAYLNSLCQNYIRTDANFAVIDEWMANWEKHQLVITGASGLGKSALVANWVKEKLTAGNRLPYRIIYHFVSNGGSTGSHGHIIKVLCDEIRDRYGFTADKEDNTDEKALEGLFNRVAAEGDKPLLIVLDAINQIIDIDNSKQLNWLPIPPKKVKILFTTLEDDRTMEVFRNRHYPVFTLQPLTKTQREEMVRGYLSIFSKKLQPHQVERIVNDKQCENTLVLKTLLDELVNFGIFEKLDEKIGTYLGTSSVEKFYGILLKGYEADFGEPFVRHALSLIAVSRNGLSEEEILAITKETPLHWSQFFCAIRQHLIVKNGLIAFAHSYIRKTVHIRYIDRKSRTYRGRYFRKEQCPEELRLITEKEEWEGTCRKGIIDVLKGRNCSRTFYEIAYQQTHLCILYDSVYHNVKHQRALDDLGHCLLIPEMFYYLLENQEDELCLYLSVLWQDDEEKGKRDVAAFIGSLVDGEESVSKLLKLCSFVLNVLKDSDFASFIAKSVLAMTSDERECSQALCTLSFAAIDDCESLVYLEKAVDILKSNYNHNKYAISDIYETMGEVYLRMEDRLKALTTLQNSLKIRMSCFGENNPSIAKLYRLIGEVSLSLDINQKALSYLQSAQRIMQSFLGEYQILMTPYYYWLGVAYLKIKQSNMALNYGYKALCCDINNQSMEILGFVDITEESEWFYKNHRLMGLAYLELGDINNALNNLCFSLRNDDDKWNASCLKDICSVFQRLGDSSGFADFWTKHPLEEFIKSSSSQLIKEVEGYIIYTYETMGK